MDLKIDTDATMKEIADIQLTWNEMLRENSELKDKLSIAGKELVQYKRPTNRGEKALEKRQVLLEQLQQQVSEIPVIKQRQVELEEKLVRAHKLLLDKDANMSRMSSEHDIEMKEAIDNFEKIKNDMTSLNSQKVIEIQNVMIKLHQEHLEILEKDRNKEVHKLQLDLSEIKQTLLENELQNEQNCALYETKLEKIKHQLDIVKRAASQNIQSLQRHYESQLRELKQTLQNHGIHYDSAIETPISKKRVCFGLSPTVSNAVSDIVFSSRQISSFGYLMTGQEIDTNNEEIETAGGDEFRSLSLDAAMKFGSENYSISNSNTAKKSDPSTLYKNNHDSKPVFTFLRNRTIQSQPGINDSCCNYEHEVVTKYASLTSAMEKNINFVPALPLDKNNAVATQNMDKTSLSLKKRHGSYKFGDLVFAKIKGWSPWPARVIAEVDHKKYSICFFGTLERGTAKENNIWKYEEKCDEFCDKYGKRKPYALALQQMRENLSITTP